MHWIDPQRGIESEGGWINHENRSDHHWLPSEGNTLETIRSGREIRLILESIATEAGRTRERLTFTDRTPGLTIIGAEGDGGSAVRGFGPIRCQLAENTTRDRR